MINNTRMTSDEISERLKDENALIDAVQRGVRSAAETHMKMGRKIPVWTEGKVVWREITAEELSQTPTSS